MPEGNKLPQKSKPTTQDLGIIWDSAGSRLSNTPLQALVDLTGATIDPVVNISFTSPNLVVTYYSGKIDNIDLTP